MKAVRSIVLVLALALFAPRAANGHDLMETSVTLVVRDGHVELRLMVPFEDALRRSLMPNETPVAFRRTAAAMPATEFARAVASLDSAIVRGTVLLVNGRPAPIARWLRPKPSEIQEGIRKVMMASIVDPASHAHPDRATISADARTSGAVTTLQVKLPAILGPYLVTAYRPTEAWVSDGSASRIIAIP